MDLRHLFLKRLFLALPGIGENAANLRKDGTLLRLPLAAAAFNRLNRESWHIRPPAIVVPEDDLLSELFCQKHISFLLFKSYNRTIFHPKRHTFQPIDATIFDRCLHCNDPYHYFLSAI